MVQINEYDRSGHETITRKLVGANNFDNYLHVVGRRTFRSTIKD